VASRRSREDPDRTARPREVEPRAAVEARDPDASLLGNETGRGHVPVRHAAPLDVRVEPALGKVREAERRDAESSHRPHGAPHGHLHARAFLQREHERRDAVDEPVLARVPHSVAVPGGAAAPDRREQLVADRIEDDADERCAPPGECDAHAVEGDAVRVVDRSVDRIDDPDPPVIPTRVLPRCRAGPHHRGLLGVRGRLRAIVSAEVDSLRARLLGEDRVVREHRTNLRDDPFLALVIHGGDDVPGALVANPFDGVEPFELDAAGDSRGPRGDREREVEVVREIGLGHEGAAGGADGRIDAGGAVGRVGHAGIVRAARTPTLPRDRLAGQAAMRDHVICMPLFTADRLTIRYPGVLALDALQLEVEPGVIGLVGANGAGKSTLIKVLLGLLRPTSGRVTVLGLDPARDGVAVRQRVGYMPEHECLPPDMVAAEFVAHMARMSGLPQDAARERSAETLRHVGLYEERYRPIGEYSTGMRQRVRLAQDLVHDPRLLLLDEPTSGLDPAGREEMLALVRRIGTTFGIAVLMASHLLGEVERVCDHLVAIDGGRLLRSAPIGDFTTRTRILAVEVGSGQEDLREALGAAGLASRVEGDLVLVELGGSDVAPPATAASHGAIADAPVAAGPGASESRNDTRVYDAIRDAVVRLDVPLLRIEERRHQLEDLFRDPATGADDGR
jgi:ABC-2 type transport system ATP-binding protein